MNIKTKIISTHLIVLVIIFLLPLAYFTPAVFEGKKLMMGDVVQHKGMSKEIADFRKEFDKEPLWTNSMFGGMPAYLISTIYKADKITVIHRILTLDGFQPVSHIFLYLLGFYIALLLFGVNPWLSLAGAITYAFSSYFLIIIEAGHISKVVALGYMPPIIAGVYNAFRGKILLGSAITGLFLALQLVVNHLQITYYTFLIILIYGIFELVDAIKNNRLLEFIKPVLVLSVFTALAIASHFTAMWTTYEYGKYSIRGKSELTTNTENKTSGLDKDYATQWSIGIDESLSLLVPNIKGAPGAFGINSKTFDFLKKNAGGTAQAKNILTRLPSYWGKQPYTLPVYAGATVCFLFIFGLFFVKGKIKWWLLTITIVSIVLSWGSNFPLVTNLMLDYFPGYNKFRSVSMAIIMAEFAMPLLSILAVKQLINGHSDKKTIIKYIKYSFYIVGGISFFLLLFPGIFGLSAPADEQYMQQGYNRLVDLLMDDRKHLLMADAFRSFIFVFLSAGIIYLFTVQKVKATHTILGLSILFLIDLWPVDKRYLNNDNFVTKRQEENPFIASTADQLILKDREPDFRVLNLSVSTFNDASTSYYHFSIGGYHGAKMRRYQELIEHHISPEINNLITVFNNQPVPSVLDSVMAKLNVLNMLNTRYIIYNKEAPPLVNKHELGNAWFVDNYKLVNNADEEIEALSAFDPRKEAIVDKRFNDKLDGFMPSPDTTARIVLTKYEPNNLIYSSKSNTEQLAVFSEIYYDKGWQAFIDGNPAPYFRADYILRAMQVPAGEHTIEFRFHPKSYYIGEKISLAGSLLLILLFFGSLYVELKKSFNQEQSS